ncbi:ATP-binding protein [Acidiphilium sp. AL]|uniref:ATP-binding protein n=1 Tax=Acidiphilium iwatense TaxID=768198 RepID=A0ABS9E179_9PROT|nr:MULTISPECIES: ATP-binding protein [Acidiphilium]MCF3948769.1 ATP-binding protein [Acidiphilium iwatense]MCU4162176.1 ATP-binding protein [Acidiphilium sp. AL]
MSPAKNPLPSWLLEEMDDFDGEPEVEGANAALLLAYAHNVIRAVEPASDEAEVLVGWLARNHTRLKLDSRLFTPGDADRSERRKRGRPIGAARWQNLAAALAARTKGASGALPPVALERGFARVTQTLGLEGLDEALFWLVYCYRLDNRFERLFDGLANAQGRPGVLRRYPDLFALLTGSSAGEIDARFRAEAPLLASGSVRLDEDGDIQLPSRLISLIHGCTHGDADVRAELLGPPRQASLDWPAFRHLGAPIEIALRVIGAAAARGESGVHVLLYGPPGTGKTECAASIAAALGLKLYVIGERSPSGREPSRGDRLSDLLLAQRLAGRTGDTLYLFDEAEDLFRPRAFDREPDPKIFVHRLLETAKVPTIWAANEIEAFSPAILRRMTQCIEIRLPPQSRRADLWRELAADETVELDDATARLLARLIPVAPSVVRTALKATRLAGGGGATAELVATDLARAMAHGRAVMPEPATEAFYEPALSHADTDLAGLAMKLSRAGAPRNVSLLLSGPPGTGKTAFARHLAAQMGLDVLQKRGSDLFGPYVGETEARIASAFAEARTTGAFLIFDEADSLLGERAGAARNWEVSQVNEMLTWMEEHPLPFACTTNLPERLDRASLRRFLIRVGFRPLRMEQAAELFRRHFGLEPPAGLGRYDRLTPADFSRIARRRAVLGTEDNAEALLTALEAEAAERDGAPRPIGFGRG